MNPLVNKTYLFIAGLIMLIIGAYIAFAPIEYLASLSETMADIPNNLQQDNTPSVAMLSDLRGMGGMLLLLGTYIFASTFRKAWFHSALLVSTLVYAAFVIFRTLGFLLDGLPQMELMIAYLIEWVMALAGIVLLKYHPVESDHRVLN